MYSEIILCSYHLSKMSSWKKMLFHFHTKIPDFKFFYVGKVTVREMSTVGRGYLRTPTGVGVEERVLTEGQEHRDCSRGAGTLPVTGVWLHSSGVCRDTGPRGHVYLGRGRYV